MATIKSAQPAPPVAESSPPGSERIDTAETFEERQTLFGAISRYPTFRRLLYSALGASAAQWMQTTALGWLALDLTDSTSYVGLVAFMAGVPFLLVSVPAGVLLDRFDRRRVLMTSQVLAAVLACLVATDVISGSVRPWHLLVAACLNGSLQAVLTPTQQSLVPSLVPRKELTNAVGLLSAAQSMTRVVGPSLAGVVIGFFGTGATFLVQAFTLLIAFAMMVTASFPAAERRTGVVDSRTMLDGLRLIARREDLKALFLLVTIPALLVFPYISFLPVFARDVLHVGPSGLGLLLGASGLGAVFGSLLVASPRLRRTSGRWLLMLTVLYGLVVATMTASRSVYLTCPMLALGSGIGANFMGANNALVQHRITDEVRGRVMGAYMLTSGLMPLGSMPMGLVADHIGAPATIAAFGLVASLLTVALGLTSRTLRQL